MKIEEIYNDWKALFPLSERHTELLRNKFTTEYNYNSNHIEGNTLTYGQTELLLLFGKVSGEGDLKDFVDMKASQVGVEMVMEAVRDKGIPLTQNFIRQLHKCIKCFYARTTPSIATSLEVDRRVIPSMPDSIRRAPTASLPDMATVSNMRRPKKRPR